MQRKITGFHQDAAAHWVAEFECGHQRHLRHNPPWQERAWVEDDAERAARVGSELPCTLCERREIPTGYAESRRTPTFNAESVPAGLRRRHTTKAGVWAKIRVLSGALDYSIDAPFHETLTLAAGETGIILPGVEHAVAPLGAVEFYVAFYSPEPAKREGN